MNLIAARPEVQFGLETVRRASELARQVQAEMRGAWLAKSDRSPVTVADFAVQALVGGLLATVFPNDPLVAEEDSIKLQRLENRSRLDRVTEFVRRALPRASPEDVCAWIDRGAAAPSARFWTLDPIDGTKGFLRGDQYAVALALIVDGRVQVGVLGCPGPGAMPRPDGEDRGFVVIAVRGHGSWSVPLHAAGGWIRLRVSACREATRARLLRSVEPEHTDVGLTEAFVRRLGIQSPPVLMDSQAKYAVLAAGGADLLVRFPSPHSPEYREYIWDHAAGSLALEEADGRITDLEGKPLDFAAGRRLPRPHGLLASNGHLHAEALEALRRLRSARC